MNAFFNIDRIAEFGNLIVYKRGAWAKREGLPTYVVYRDDGAIARLLKESNDKQSAIKWAQTNTDNKA